MVLVCGLGLAWVITHQPPAPLPAPPAPGTPAAVSAAAGTPADPGTVPAVAAPPVTPAVEPVKAEETTLSNAAAEFTFTNLGGGIKQVKILAGQYAGRTEQIMNEGGNAPIGGLLNAQGAYDLAAYQITSQSERAITYNATVNGVEITKAWTMREGEPTEGWGYIWNLNLSFKNTGTSTSGDYFLHAGLLNKLHSTEPPDSPASDWFADNSAGKLPSGKFDASSGFLGFGAGPAQSEIRTPLENLAWGGVYNQYYSSIISPDAIAKDKPIQLLSRRKWVEFDDPGRDRVKAWASETSVELPGSAAAPGATTAWSGQIYTGPRSGTVLSNVGGDRNEAMHYGWFSSLSRLFLGALNLFHKYVPFGLAIVFLTLVVRLVIWPLSLKATKSMKRMAKLSPLMTDLKEKYKHDPQKMQVETMKLYRDYGVNPVGGCLPVLLQFPIFLGYYSMMMGAVEMRGHPFLWVNDLSLPDTVFTHPLGFTILGISNFTLNPLPLIMAVTMYIQMKVAPQPTQTNPQMEMQQKIFKIMPLFFLMFCYSTASALALYWSVQNVISIFQTWIVSKQPEQELKKVPKKPGFLERAQAAALEAQKAKGTRPPTPGGGKSTFKKG